MTESRRRSIFAGNALKQLAEGFAERKNLAQLISAEVRAGSLGAGSFAADLDNADNFVAGKYRRADDLLYEFGALAADFHALKNGGMADARKVIDDIGTAFAGRARGDGRVARKGDETDLLQRFRDKEVQVTPAIGNAHDGNFVGFYAEIFRDTFRNAGERDLGRGGSVGFDGGCDALQFRSKVVGRGHGISVENGEVARREGPGGYYPLYFSFKRECVDGATIFKPARVREANRLACIGVFICLY